MSSQVRLDLTIPSTEATFIGKTRPSDSTPHRNFDALSSYFAAIAGGVYAGAMVETTGAVQSQATLTVSAGGSSNGETMSLANVTFTAETSGATGNQFNISATAATQAANMVAAFNASPDLAGIVTASNVLGVITLTAVAPGTVGNGIQLSESLSNVAITHAFGTSVAGVDGHTYTYSIGQ